MGRDVDGQIKQENHDPPKLLLSAQVGRLGVQCTALGLEALSVLCSNVPPPPPAPPPPPLAVTTTIVIE